MNNNKSVRMKNKHNKTIQIKQLNWLFCFIIYKKSILIYYENA